MCQPFVVASGQTLPNDENSNAIAVDDTSVYWAIGGADVHGGGPHPNIMAWTKYEDASAELLRNEEAPGYIEALVSGGDAGEGRAFLYYASIYGIGTLSRVNPFSKGYSVTNKEPFPSGLTGLVSGGEEGAYWTEEGPTDGGFQILVRYWNPGSDPVDIGQTSQAGSFPGISAGLAVDGHYVYYAVNTNPPVVCAVPQAGCDGSPCLAEPIAEDAGAQGIFGFAADDSYVYWTARESHSIQRRSLVGTDASPTTVTILSGLGDPGFIAVDAKYLYWTDVSTGRVYFAIKDGTQGVLELASGQSFPLGIVLDTNAVYWTNQGTVYGPSEDAGLGSIMGVAKPL